MTTMLGAEYVDCVNDEDYDGGYNGDYDDVTGIERQCRSVQIYIVVALP